MIGSFSVNVCSGVITQCSRCSFEVNPAFSLDLGSVWLINPTFDCKNHTKTKTIEQEGDK